MTVHTCRPGHPGILADGCARCAEQALPPWLDLDDEKLERLWDLMLRFEYGGDQGPPPETQADRSAARGLYLLAVWMQRNVGLDPWRPLAEIRVRPADRSAS